MGAAVSVSHKKIWNLIFTKRHTFGRLRSRFREKFSGRYAKRGGLGTVTEKMTGSPMQRAKRGTKDSFLPPPGELVVAEEAVKVTIALKKSSIEFFKKEAEKYHTKYQKMIRELLDKYASRYQAVRN